MIIEKLEEIRKRLAALGAEHMAPLYSGAAMGLFRLEHITQETGPHGRPKDWGGDRWVLIIGDDPGEGLSKGPAAFDSLSIKKHMKAATGVITVSCEPMAEAYALAAMEAAEGGRAILIETLPAHEIQWIELLHRHAPHAEHKHYTYTAGSA